MEETSFPSDWDSFHCEEYPLHKAAREGRLDILEKFVSLGSNVNILNHDRESPLHEACFCGRYECVMYLLDNFASLDARSIDNATPLCMASAMGHVPCVKLLLDKGAEVNPAFVLCTPLHEAVLRHNVVCAELLINAGANLEASDCDIGRPLHAACVRNSYTCCKLLLQAENPPSLKHLCRLKIHQSVKPRNLKVINELHIPRSVLKFILCERINKASLKISPHIFLDNIAAITI
uniref:SOCS box domain-containing protein n=1 Tax=Strigamia maritima TaxID=126957 RepID=T1IVC0_STRMM